MRIKENQNRELVQEIRTKLSENGGYCPCKLERTKENKCICKEFRDMIENEDYGECHCGLYILTKE